MFAICNVSGKTVAEKICQQLWVSWDVNHPTITDRVPGGEQVPPWPFCWCFMDFIRKQNKSSSLYEDFYQLAGLLYSLLCWTTLNNSYHYAISHIVWWPTLSKTHRKPAKYLLNHKKSLTRGLLLACRVEFCQAQFSSSSSQLQFQLQRLAKLELGTAQPQLVIRYNANLSSNWT